MNRKLYKLNLVGDVMLGRLIDQMFPTHVQDPEDASIARVFKLRNPHLSNYGADSPWGNGLKLFKEADLNIINLETSVTTHTTRWANKVFNYRMHPANISALRAAHIDYASLANNHTLDFDVEGLRETMKTLKDARISFAGIGNNAEEAQSAANVNLPHGSDPSSGGHVIQIYSAADHPGDWGRVPGFHLIDYGASSRERLKALLTKPQGAGRDESPPSLRIFSVHWGPNYSWTPDKNIQSLAHFLIDECGIDVIHGHSAHHVQGVEKYKGKLIMYGCGDFVDDYAVTQGYRNDLSALWSLTVEETEPRNLELVSLEVHPNRIENFQSKILDMKDPDHGWLVETIIGRSRSDFGTEGFEFAKDGHLVLSLKT